MKVRKTATRRSTKEDLDWLLEELGADAIQALHEAYRQTAAAIYRRAVERTEAQLGENGK